MLQDIHMELKLPIIIEKKERWFVSSCPLLDVYSQGETYEKAQENIIEALTAFFEGCLEMGTLEQVLKECGIRPAASLPTRNGLTNEDNYVNVPIHLIANSELKTSCHA
jgi:predicted RNase H-like HicB family nuclease